MTAKLPMWKQALNYHKQMYPDDFGVVVKDEHYYPKLAELLITRRTQKAFSYLDIEPIESSLMVSRSSPVVVRAQGGNKLMFKDASGAFRVRLSKDEVVHIVRCRLNSSLCIEYAVGRQSAILQLHNLCRTGSKNLRRNLPKKGLWDCEKDNGLIYHRPKPSLVKEASAFSGHPQYENLESDFIQFFEDIDFYTRYGQAGMRKVLMAGPPGTGKTTLARVLAANYSSKYAFIQADGSTFRDVCYEAARRSTPTIVIAEEVDHLYKGYAGAEILSFLDGIKTPRNVAGTYVIFSTNYPKAIDERILKRPGRIDRVIPVGAFRRKAAAVCAQHYLPDDCHIPAKDLGAVLDRCTAAEIKEIIVTAFGVTRVTREELTAKTLEHARELLTGRLKRAAETCEEDMDDRQNEFKERGPGVDHDELIEEVRNMKD
ncbi:ATP-binding protein [Pseudomonas sp. GOM7]|uniref:AAA family ATPase n=1 Tax=Pseudomonas sp. GOM7 TaxID=2998079 RepID=UPI00227CE8F8|nr:ATP-binding protein [Pseudomonas sp. GOM7]WAJ37235.1 ATP-binding protein [Pseudomonas sp. GOM7]